VDIKVEIEDQGVKALLAGLQERCENPTPAMKEIGEIVRSSIIKNFEQSGRPNKWQPLAAATIKKKRGGAGKTLIDSARLMNSITTRAHSNRVEIGTSVIYARIHQLGGIAGRGRKVEIPARPYLMVQDEDWSPIREVLSRYLTGGTK